MVAIQLGRQVIERDHRPFAALFGIVLGLRQQAGEGGQLGLATRKGVAAGDGGKPDAPVRPMRPHRGIAGQPIAVPRQQQRIGQ
ncbi:hypothetical protein D3C72_2068940 [compost metagenome]